MIIEITAPAILWAADWREEGDAPLPIKIELNPPNALAKAVYLSGEVRHFVDLEHLCREHRINAWETAVRRTEIKVES